MRWGLLAAAVMWALGCTAIYISGDDNDVDFEDAKKVDIKDKEEE